MIWNYPFWTPKFAEKTNLPQVKKQCIRGRVRGSGMVRISGTNLILSSSSNNSSSCFCPRKIMTWIFWRYSKIDFNTYFLRFLVRELGLMGIPQGIKWQVIKNFLKNKGDSMRYEIIFINIFCKNLASISFLSVRTLFIYNFL